MRYSDAKQRLLSSLRREVRDERVLEALAEVPREQFMPPGLADQAYENEAFPIGYEQTISQPLMVAVMLEAMELRSGGRVLEVGTGSGYQAAVLARLAAHVVSVERVRELADSACARLEALGCSNVEVHLAGEQLGWPAGAPYDAIVVAASAPSAPPVLIEQLAEGGRLVVPVGSPFEQRLAIVHRRGQQVEVRWGDSCRFVPLLGAHGWGDEPVAR